jgi:hypothetical protein
MGLLQLAGYGTDAIGLAVGGWHASTKIVERARKVDTRLVGSGPSRAIAFDGSAVAVCGGIVAVARIAIG